MMTFEELAPSKTEEQLTEGMPEQVRIGYVRARRKAHGGRRVEDNKLFGGLFDMGNPPPGARDLFVARDLFGGVFGS